VTINGTAIKGSPWNIHVSEGCSGGELSEMTILFQSYNKNGERLTSGGGLSFITTDLGNDDEPGEVVDLDDGKYTLDYEAVPGKNSINIKIDGKSVGGCPLNFTV